MMHLLAMLTSVNGYLACTLGPLWLLGMVAARVVARRVGDGWH